METSLYPREKMSQKHRDLFQHEKKTAKKLVRQEKTPVKPVLFITNGEREDHEIS
ncbi:hypothetical protein PRBRB14_18770 [Hallella multisaccharivorax DSM 17128]|nr:hypothetical protein PRBRB14_18770 [Hallella multisaccharivorax DSM 17128]